MTQTILCAIDINRPKEEAHVLEAAKRLADLDDAQLDVITVMPDFGSGVVGVYFKDHQVKAAKDSASEALEKLVSNVLGPDHSKKVRHVVAVGKAYEEVLHAAKVSQADLIVIGAQRPDFKDYLLGPNAARVVRHATCSVYVVRAD
ncbi:universal stress protein [Thalassorhabdomicrobium marinisediminis]|uniref:Universal stress protein n=1 Tax=Thalassorhabdomicrobium marinisediminis TaxID=2170577 RepID=A0A2T7FTA6_9RHOB|nr:universal stress protein [Thalassorhabdomicrobium marinisediminis]PVA05401.1 universal stress protein [Thalassorhabdomicrobium marinisediminis]